MRLVALILFFSLVSAGQAWTLDTHVESLVGHHSVAEIDQDSAATDVDDAPCDHCCHAGAHLMGIPMDGTRTDCPVGGAHSPVEPNSIRSVSLDLPTPPP